MQKKKLNRCIFDYRTRKLLPTVFLCSASKVSRELFSSDNFKQAKKQLESRALMNIQITDMHLSLVDDMWEKIKIIINYFIFVDLFNQFLYCKLALPVYEKTSKQSSVLKAQRRLAHCGQLVSPLGVTSFLNFQHFPSLSLW